MIFFLKKYFFYLGPPRPHAPRQGFCTKSLNPMHQGSAFGNHPDVIRMTTFHPRRDGRGHPSAPPAIENDCMGGAR